MYDLISNMSILLGVGFTVIFFHIESDRIVLTDRQTASDEKG